MSMRMFSIALVVSVALTIASVSGQETPKQVGVPVMIKFVEHEPAGGSDQVEREGAEERIRHLLAEAEEIEGRAAELRAEAMELKRALSGEHEGGDEDRAAHEGIERLDRRLAELNEAAERAAHVGREGEARELRMEAERVAEELEAHHKHVKRAEFHEAEQHLENLHREMQEARERGEEERVGHLEREAEEVTQMLRREHENREVAQHMENMHRELEELNGAVERAEREGHDEEARELHGRAMEVAERIGMHQREMDEHHLHDLGQHLENLEREMHAAREHGQEQDLVQLEREAEEVRMTLQRERESREMATGMQNMHHEVAELSRAAELAEREGRHEQAREMHGRAMEGEERIRQHEDKMHERHLHEAEMRIGQLEREAREARERGRHDEAERMMAEAGQIERDLRVGREGRGMDEQMGRLHEVMEELAVSYRRAVEEGRLERTEELRALVGMMADMVAGHLREGSAEHHERSEHGPEAMAGFGAREISVVIRPGARPDHESPFGNYEGPEHGPKEKPGFGTREISVVMPANDARMHVVDEGDVWDVDEKIGQLRERARNAEERGDDGKAEALSEEADQLERYMRSMDEPADDEAQPPLEDEVGKLRREVQDLRRDLDYVVRALKERIGDF